MACPSCFLPAYSGVSLSNGEVIHAECLQKLKNSVVAADQALSAERTHVATLRSQLASQSTYLGKMVRFFGRGIDSEILKSNLKAAEADLVIAEAVCRTVNEVAVSVYDLMLDYPPDWSQRSAAVAARDKVCVNCGSSKTLQAHHIVPLSKGGTNQLSNLKLLCERCHQHVHGGKEFISTKSDEPLAIADRVQLLKSAIASGEDVEFLYRKPTDKSHRRRRVTPYALVEVDHEHDEGQTLCLNGYCHLRNEERNFALKRMKGVKYAKG